MTLNRHHLSLASAFLVVVILSGCGGGSDDQISNYRNQTVSWGVCDTQRLASEDAAFALQLGTRVSCAEIRAPMDYSHPDHAEIRIALMRVKGSNGRDDNPAILFNPGGPGDDGWSYGLLTARTWSSSRTTEDQDVVKAYQQMAQQYDLVGFSPRGIGWSTRLTCSRMREPYPVADPTRQLDPSNIENTLLNSRLIAQSCENEPLMPFINTDATARDLDLIRHLLHQDKLNYIGLSYGTWLGNWYAGLFPERVGRMLFSGVTDFAIPLSHQNLVEDEARQKVFDSVVLPYTANNPTRFGFDPAITLSSLRELINGLPDRLHSTLVNDFIDRNLLASAQYANYAALTMRAAQVLGATLKNHPNTNEASLTALVEQEFLLHSTLPADFNMIALNSAKSMIKRYFNPNVSDDSMYWAIVCNDTGTNDTPETWVAQSNNNASHYPDFGGAVRENACLYWRKSKIAKPAQERSAQAGPIVMLQGTMDPSTVLAGAMNSLSLLPNASMVLIEGEITHAPLPPYGKTCVDKPIAEYFLTGKPPPRTTTCSKLPLESFALTQ